jgi:DNA mismatch repair protein MutS
LVFLRKIIPGWIKKSFGLEVAKLAWINKSILTEARKMLNSLENKELCNSQLSFWNFDEFNKKIEEKIIIKEIEKESEIEERLKNINLDNLTPIEALNLINEFKNKI